MKKIIIIIAAVLISFPVLSQYPVLSKDVNLFKETPKFGQNRKHFVHNYMGFGMVFGNNESTDYKAVVGLSSNFEYGIRYKLKLCNFNAIGFQFAYNLYSYRLEDFTAFGAAYELKKSKLVTQNLTLAFYDRINFGKRGNYIGKFLDLGGYVDFPVAKTRYFAVNFPQTREIISQSVSRINNIEFFNYGAYVHIGFNKFVLFGKYRLSDMTADLTKEYEMPRITAGIQFGLY